MFFNVKKKKFLYLVFFHGKSHVMALCFSMKMSCYSLVLQWACHAKSRYSLSQKKSSFSIINDYQYHKKVMPLPFRAKLSLTAEKKQKKSPSNVLILLI